MLLERLFTKVLYAVVTRCTRVHGRLMLYTLCRCRSHCPWRWWFAVISYCDL